MNRVVLIAAAVAIGVAAAAAAAAASSGGQGVTPEQHEQFQQAVRDAGLEGQNVTGRYVPGKGWEIEKADTEQDGSVSFGG
jgi:opacity protein-like surface antigen